MANDLIRARLVYDGGDVVHIPPEMGEPRGDQMQGTPAEQLTELAGRVCYDSLGKGRPSFTEDVATGVDPHTGEQLLQTVEGYHDHIRKVGHGSVWEHFNFTVELPNSWKSYSRDDRDPYFALDLLNRPGVYVRVDDNDRIRITLNLRALAEWDKFSRDGTWKDSVGWLIARDAGEGLAPAIIDTPPYPFDHEPPDCFADLAEPETDEERWVSMFVSGSRGLSHELVRHGDFTAISQRCLSGDTVITFACRKNRAYSGNIGRKTRTLKWLYEKWQDPRIRTIVRRLRPRVLDESTGLFTSTRLLDVVYSGRNPCFRVNLARGYSVTCTVDHRLMTNQGWKTLREIANPTSLNGIAIWNKDSKLKIACNGTAVVGLGLYRNREWLHDRYWVKRMSLSDMAIECGCSTHIIRTWLKKFQLQRPRSEINRGRSPWNKGKQYSTSKPYSLEAIERYRQSKTGDRNPQWKGGIGTEERRQFQVWKKQNRRLVFERDGYRCRLCERKACDIPYNGRHQKKRQIEIHHILPLYNRPDLACDINNMATLCWKCQCKVNNHELEFAPQLLDAIKSPVPFVPSDRKRKQSIRKVRAHYQEIESIEYAGEIDTYDLCVEGPWHGFVGDGVVVHNSTRFVDESRSPCVKHPLLKQFARFLKTEDKSRYESLHEMHARPHTLASDVYDVMAGHLEPWLISRGVDRQTARKQARGAARGYLGNALYTELIFSASVAQWKRILRQRASVFADAEIRELACKCLAELKRSRYGERFDAWELRPSPDGIGEVAVEVAQPKEFE